MLSNKKDFISDKQKYLDALTDYFLEVFPELSDVISSKGFGVLEYSKAELHKTFYEFMTLDLPEMLIPKEFPCLFFCGINDTVFGLQSEYKKVEYSKQIRDIAPHAKILNIKIDHFGRGEEHHIIQDKGLKFLIEND